MSSVDLEKYKQAWKNEPRFNDRRLPENQLLTFMQSSSKGMAVIFKKGLVFDMVFKTVLLAALVYLFLLLHGQSDWRILVLLSIVIILAGLFWQLKTLQRIPFRADKGQSALGRLRELIDFYYRFFTGSIYVGALSGAIFFLTGSSFYYTFKYGEIPSFQTDDYVVLGLGFLLCYGLGAVAQLAQYRFHIRQLEESIRAIEENSMDEETLQTLKSRKIKNRVRIVSLIILGLTILLALILKGTA